MPNPELEQRYQHTLERVANAAKSAGRRPEDILVVAVSKYSPVEDIQALAKLGHKDFGESQAQQLTQRAAILEELISRERTIPQLAYAGQELFTTAQQQRAAHDVPLRWHMVGHLQRNKVKKLLPSVRLIHSVDSLRLVDEIHSIAFKKDIEVELLVQVNVTNEPQKSGCPVAAAEHLCEQIDDLVHLKVRGLMAMGPTSQDERETRLAFDRARELYEDIEKRDLCEGRFNILSMGMSGDFEIAIEHGANMVRVGSSIFGPRPAQPDDTSPGDSDDS